jgi:hypothetical protein
MHVVKAWYHTKRSSLHNQAIMDPAARAQDSARAQAAPNRPPPWAPLAIDSVAIVAPAGDSADLSVEAKLDPVLAAEEDAALGSLPLETELATLAVPLESDPTEFTPAFASKVDAALGSVPLETESGTLAVPVPAPPRLDTLPAAAGSELDATADPVAVAALQLASDVAPAQASAIVEASKETAAHVGQPKRVNMLSIFCSSRRGYNARLGALWDT